MTTQNGRANALTPEEIQDRLHRFNSKRNTTALTVVSVTEFIIELLAASPVEQPACRACDAGVCSVHGPEQRMAGVKVSDSQPAAAPIDEQESHVAYVNSDGFIIEKDLLLAPGTKLYTRPGYNLRKILLELRRLAVSVSQSEMLDAIDAEIKHASITSQPAPSPADEPSELEQVIACLGDDAATLRHADEYVEMADNMEAAARLLGASEEVRAAEEMCSRWPWQRTASAQADAPTNPHDLPIMRKAFRVTEVSGDPDPAKQRFYMRFSFPSIEALHAADDEWNKFIARAPSPADERAAFEAHLIDTYGVVQDDDPATERAKRDWTAGWQAARAASANETVAEGATQASEEFRQIALTELYEFQELTGCSTSDEYRAKLAAMAAEAVAWDFRMISSDAPGEWHRCASKAHADELRKPDYAGVIEVRDLFAAPLPAQADARVGLTDEQFEDWVLTMLINHLDSKALHYCTFSQMRDGIEITRVTTYTMDLVRALLQGASQ